MEPNGAQVRARCRYTQGDRQVIQATIAASELDRMAAKLRTLRKWRNSLSGAYTTRWRLQASGDYCGLSIRKSAAEVEGTLDITNIVKAAVEAHVTAMQLELEAMGVRLDT